MSLMGYIFAPVVNLQETFFSMREVVEVVNVLCGSIFVFTENID